MIDGAEIQCWEELYHGHDLRRGLEGHGSGQSQWLPGCLRPAATQNGMDFGRPLPRKTRPLYNIFQGQRMPPNQRCPACARLVPDWHREWHSLEDQKNIFDGNAAMECPFCKGNIAYDKFLMLAVAESGRSLAKRDLLKAAEWARTCDGKTLREYLDTPPGAPYCDSWTDVEIQAADSKVAAKPE